MARDPYEVLGVSKKATEAEIKKAFRTLAKKHHPDTHGNDPKAVKRFQEISSAYEVIGDKEKRAQYDRGEIDEAGQPRGFNPGAGPGGFGQGWEGFPPAAGRRPRRRVQLEQRAERRILGRGHLLRYLRRHGRRADGPPLPAAQRRRRPVPDHRLARGSRARREPPGGDRRQAARCPHSARRQGRPADPPARTGPAGRPRRTAGRRADQHHHRASPLPGARWSRS